MVRHRSKGENTLFILLSALDLGFSPAKGYIYPLTGDAVLFICPRFTISKFAHANSTFSLCQFFASPLYRTLRKMAELQKRSSIRYLLLDKIHVHEFAERIAVIDCVLYALIGEVEPNLKQIHPQHFLNAHCWSAALA